MDIAQLLQICVEHDPRRIAVTGVDGASLTTGELLERARSAAAGFRAQGARYVGYLGTNGSGLPVTLFGAALAGVPFVPFNYRLADEQIADMAGQLPCLVVVTASVDTRPLDGLDVDVVDVDDLAPAAAGVEGDEPAVGDPDGVAVLLYTSGTTASPKAAVLRHRHLVSYVLGTVDFAAAGSDEAVLVSVPPYHVAGVSTILTNLFNGRRIVYLDPFDPARWLDVVRDEGITHAMVVPTMLARLVEHLGDQDADVPSLRSLAYGGARMPGVVIERALERFPDVAFTNAYGLTETSSTITVLGPDDHRAALSDADPERRSRLSSAGRPVPGIEILVLGLDGEHQPAGEVGDILVRGDQVSGEYATGSTLDAAGWFSTRDRGWLDDDGYLFIEGRSDDTIIRGGENIAPAEIEEVLRRHPAVGDCAVVGVPDAEWGQRIAAFVVLRPGSACPSDELKEWARGRLRSAKTPDVIETRDDLPYTATGKLLRRELVASLTTPAAREG